MLAAQAANDVGITELYEQIEKHYAALQESGRLAARRRKQRRADLLRNIENTVTTQTLQVVLGDEDLNRYLERVESGDIDPYAAADEILSHETLVTWVEKWLARVRRNSTG